jgi:hypothetical protein
MQARIFSMLHIIQTPLGTTQPLPGSPPTVVELPGIEASHSVKFGTQVKNAWSNMPIFPHVKGFILQPVNRKATEFTVVKVI